MEVVATAPMLSDDIWSCIIAQSVLIEDISCVLRLRLVSQFFDVEVIRFTVTTRARELSQYAHRNNQIIPLLVGVLPYRFEESGHYFAGHESSQDELNKVLHGATDEILRRFTQTGKDIKRRHVLHGVCSVWLSTGCIGPQIRHSFEGEDGKAKLEKEINMSTLIIAMLSDPGMYEEMLSSELVDLNLTTKFFRSPLYVATECRRLDLIKPFLDLGANPHNDLGNGLTAAGLVACYGWVEVFQMFLDPKYDLDPSCKGYGKVAEKAAITNQFEIVDMILKQHDHVCDVYRNTDLFAYACQNSQDVIVSKMLDHGADPNGRNSLITLYPLVEAARHHLSTVILLLDRGASHEYEDRCALVTALRARKFEIVNLMLDRGLTTDILNLFVTAINSNNISFAQSLLLRGYKIDWSSTKDLGLDHSILGVIQNSHKETMYWLVLQCGLNANSTLMGPPLLFHAIRSASTEMVKCLFEIGATPINYEALCDKWSQEYPTMPPKEELSLSLNTKWGLKLNIGGPAAKE